MTNSSLTRARLTAPLVDDAEIEALPIEAIAAELDRLGIDHGGPVRHAREQSQRPSPAPIDRLDRPASLARPRRPWSTLLWPAGLVGIAASLLITAIAVPESWQSLIGDHRKAPVSVATPATFKVLPVPEPSSIVAPPSAEPYAPASVAALSSTAPTQEPETPAPLPALVGAPIAAQAPEPPVGIAPGDRPETLREPGTPAPLQDLAALSGASLADQAPIWVEPPVATASVDHAETLQEPAAPVPVPALPSTPVADAAPVSLEPPVAAATVDRYETYQETPNLAALPVERPAVEPAPVPAQSYRIQLVAAPSEDDAERAWLLFRDELGDLLDGLEPHIERADTGNGAHYRLQIGGFDDRRTADALCRTLKRRHANCFVVRRPG